MTATFEIDTGRHGHTPAAWRVDRCRAMLDAAGDMLPEGADQAAIDAVLVGMILGDLSTPKRALTVRRHFCQLWPLISPLAEREPHQFDSILQEFSELMTTLG